jgi:Cu(I)/Ag(I) efflux system membrane protein CusA/SilA
MLATVVCISAGHLDASDALVDRTGTHDLAELTRLQTWFLKFELQTVPGVFEVATFGGMVRQNPIVVDPEKLRAYAIPPQRMMDAVQNANREVGGSVLALVEAENMVRTRGYLTSLEDIELIAVDTAADGTPVLLRDIGRVQIGPEMRRVVTDLDGERPRGEAAVEVEVGFIALSGVAAEFDVVMLVYLANALEPWRAEGRLNTVGDLKAAIEEGAATPRR